MSGFSRKDPVQQPSPPGPGARLGEARKARELDLAKTAKMLHLTVETVQLLEQDAYTELPARVFVRGYLKSYARLLELPEEEILAGFDQRCPDRECVRVIPETTAQENTGIAAWMDMRRIAIWAGGLLAAGLLLFLLGKMLGALFETSQSPDAPPEPPAQSGSGELSIPDVRKRPEQVTVGTDSQASPTPVPAAGEPDSSETVAGSTAEPAATPAPIPETLPTGAVVEEAGVGEPVVAEQESVREPGFVMHFTGPAWVDIRDRSGAFRLNGDMQAGSSVRLEGEPPYRVRLSDYQQVAISIDGQPYDLGPFIDDRGTSGKVYLEFELQAP